MASVSEIRAKVAEKLSTIQDLTGVAEPWGQVNPPAALVLPGEPAIVYGARMNNRPDLNLVIVLLVESGDAQLSQAKLDPYLDDTGPKSVRAAVNGTLDGLASIARVTMVQSYGQISYEAARYLGAEFLLSITAR